jgi:hypothetical protein
MELLHGQTRADDPESNRSLGAGVEFSHEGILQCGRPAIGPRGRIDLDGSCSS